MLLQVEGYQRSKYKNLFDQMFRLRKAVFHDQKKWDVKIVDGVHEIDEYDRDDTVYILALDAREKVIGTMRLLSTLTPHMMIGPFRPMFPDIALRSPNIWEVTRLAVLDDVNVQPNNVSTAACELMLGTIQFGLANGLSHYTFISETPLARVYRRCGLVYDELGRAQTPHGSIFAALGAITAQLEHNVIAATGLNGDRPAFARAA